MPWLGLAAALSAAAFFVDRLTDAGSRSGILAPESQTTTPDPSGSIGHAADRLSGAAAIGLLLVAGAFALKVAR